MPDSEEDQDGQSGDPKEFLLELNFVPTWARAKPAAPVAPAGRGGGGRERRDKRDGGRGRDGDRGRGQDRGGQRSGAGRGSAGRGGAAAGRPDRRPERTFVERAPVRVDFIPDRERLHTVAKAIRQSGRAYALHELGSRFMANGRLFAVKYTLHDSARAEGVKLYQCKTSRLVFLDEPACRDHAVDAVLATRFKREETEVEPPKGNFTCVGRCRIKGELVGPPNFHGFNEAVEKLRQETYPQHNASAFRQQIEMVHEEEVVEAWKQERSKAWRFGLKDGPEEAQGLDRRAAQKLIRNELLGGEVVETRKAIMPGYRAEELIDERLARSTREVLGRDERALRSISLALRPALKHMHLHLFRTGKDQFFVTGTKPAALHAQVTEDLGATLEFVGAHPGCKKEELIEKRFPGQAEHAPDVVHLLSSVRWLVERGHVIEFYDGSMAVPRA